MVFTVPTTVAFLLFLLSFLPLVIFRNGKHNKKLPPGPASLPIIGNLHRFGLLPHRSLYKLSRIHGPLMYLKLGSVPAVVASSAAVAKELLKTHDLETCSRPPLFSLRRLSYGFSDVAFAPYGEQWRELRRICITHLFNTKKVSSYRRVREEEVRRMIGSVSESSSRGAEINLSEEGMSLAYDVTCRTALGKRYCNSGGELLRILGETQALFNGFFFSDYLPALGWLDAFTGMRARLEKNFRELDEFYQRVIDEHQEGGGSVSDQDAIVDVLLGMKATHHLTDDHVKGVLMNIFVAGSDTSSATLEWAMTQLMRNPQVMRRAQDEVRTVVRSKEYVEESDLDQLHYLKAVVKETMRLHSPAPLLVQRETIHQCEINGHIIPAKTRLLVNTLAVGRDPEAWERAGEFIPERFVDSVVDFRGHHFQFIPFGAGRRMCPGLNIGVLVVELALANLLRSFDWELPGGMVKEEIDMGEAPGVTVHRRVPIRLVAQRVEVLRDTS